MLVVNRLSVHKDLTLTCIFYPDDIDVRCDRRGHYLLFDSLQCGYFQVLEDFDTQESLFRCAVLRQISVAELACAQLLEQFVGADCFLGGLLPTSVYQIGRAHV